MSGTWGAPNVQPWRDDFATPLLPEPEPVDDLSRFVLQRIRFTETEPRHDVPQAYDRAAGPIAHRYAVEMRRDMVAFRKIVAEYCTEWTARVAEHPAEKAGAFDRFRGLRWGVRACAERWADHPDFREEWRIE